MIGLTWEDLFNIPAEEAINDTVQEHDNDGPGKAHSVIRHRTLPNVLPVETLALLLIPRNVERGVAERRRRRETLKSIDSILIHFIIRAK